MKEISYKILLSALSILIYLIITFLQIKTQRAGVLIYISFVLPLEQMKWYIISNSIHKILE
ncbi:hypothetical protein DW063_11175 [Ruminococcus sp. AF43-11]|nr:hypothetical protein DW063_11175 [Ruminococcus sp. AF43-11]